MLPLITFCETTVEGNQAEAFLPGRKHRLGAHGANHFLPVGDDFEIHGAGDGGQAGSDARARGDLQARPQFHPRADQIGAIARDLAPPTLQLLHETRGIAGP